ncbi:2-amino-4-oxopentanoate thiolase subunit OrtA [Sporohalobacter salinus]|uniref:2-amino-4-oxopentanoate thiolase subunit OrtA n=1 Tax=Sporohalobacter salinus TaxID=1494606 RepID=UPI00195F63B2|nr:2-amino-4-oxopentanoate thiolase subunit OrtA [Sporohalobacter salinus]MBM7622801.1 hypothetical protein [Sporohalobacter salinus]
MSKAKEGDWVQIHNVVLEADKRAPNLPKETKKVPLELRVRGFLVDEEAKVDDEVTVETLIGRKLSGRLEDTTPTYEHNFGKPVSELLPIGRELKAMLEGNDE